MGKRVSATEMLSAGRQRPPTPAETGTERLDDQTSERLNGETTSALDDQATRPLDHQTSERQNGETTSAVSDQATRPLDDQTSEQREIQHLNTHSSPNGQPPATYQRITVFLTPAQRQWLKLTARQLPDGLSGSDIVRLAMSRLAQEVTGGLDLVSNLTDQAHSDAEVFSGRRNRGLPPRADVDA